MQQKLRKILDSLVTEFNTHKEHFLSDNRLSLAVINGKHHGRGDIRSSGRYTSHSKFSFNYDFLRELITECILQFQSTVVLNSFVVESKLWHSDIDLDKEHSFERITNAIASGFLIRNFQLNSNKILITHDSYETSFKELLSFFSKGSVTKDFYISLYGLTGELPIVHLTDYVSIVKADYQLAELYNIYFSDEKAMGLEMFEGDYLLKISFPIEKARLQFPDSLAVRKEEQQAINKWINVCLLSIPGFLDIANVISLSNDWPATSNCFVVSHNSSGRLPIFKKRLPSLEACIHTLAKTADIVGRVQLEKLDEKIIHSISRLEKSKATQSVNDRVVELAIAFEYLIATETRDVTLTLKLKAIRLVNDNNTDLDIFKKIGQFYKLRSGIVHGKTTKISDELVGVIDYTEVLVQKMIIRYIQLLPYSYKDIDNALSKAMYICHPLDVILENDYHDVERQK